MHDPRRKQSLRVRVKNTAMGVWLVVAIVGAAAYAVGCAVAAKIKGEESLPPRVIPRA